MDNKQNRELVTVEKMINIYCQGVHGSRGERCAQCEELYRYAARKIERCPHGVAKPVCAQCQIHCYKPDMREAIRTVMRYAGPKMVYRHPLLAFHHLLHKFSLSGKRGKKEAR